MDTDETEPSDATDNDQDNNPNLVNFKLDSNDYVDAHYSPTLPSGGQNNLNTKWFYENIQYIQGYLTVSNTDTPYKTPHQFITWLRNTYNRSQNPSARGRSEETLKVLRTDLVNNLRAGSCSKEIFDFIDKYPQIVGLEVIQVCKDEIQIQKAQIQIQNLN